MKDMDTPVIAAPTRGRRPIDGPAPATPDIVSDQTTRAYVDELRQDTAVMPKAQLAQSLRVAEAAGMIAAFQYNETANRVAMLKLFAQIRDSKAYKGARVTDRASGETVTVTTWEEFCIAYGYSKTKIHEDLQNLAAFGGDFMEMQEKLGLGYRDLRLLRNGIAALPPEERQAILDDVAAAEGPEEVKEKLADLRLELAKAKADRKELEADMQAKEKVSKEKSEKLDALEEQVARLTSMSPDDKVTARNEANAQARADVDSECQAVFVAVMGLASRCAAVMQDERSTDETCMWIHKRVSVLANSVAEALLGAGIDVDLRAYLELPQDDGTDMNDNRE